MDENMIPISDAEKLYLSLIKVGMEQLQTLL